MREHRYWVYILVSRSLSVMYIGVTNDLGRRIAGHKIGQGSEFVKKYNVTKLVYAEEFEQIEQSNCAREAAKRLETRAEKRPRSGCESQLGRAFILIEVLRCAQDDRIYLSS